MAKVTLLRVEAEEGLIPPVCMECGEPATETVIKRFVWHPSWTLLLMLCGLLPWLLFMLLTEQKLRMRAPFCELHRNHWQWRNRVGLIGLGVALALFAGWLGLLSLPGLEVIRDAIGGWYCLGVFAVGVVWFFVWAILQDKAVQIEKLTEDRVVFKNVSPVFAEAARATRAANPERVNLLLSDRKSTSSSPLVVVAVLFAFLIIIALVAIGNIGHQGAPPGPKVPVGPAPAVDIVNNQYGFRVKYPGAGWSLTQRPGAEKDKDTALVTAIYLVDEVYGLVFAEQIPPGAKLDGLEKETARDIIAGMELKEMQVAQDFATVALYGGQAVRYQVTGTDPDGMKVRVQTTVFIRQGNLYQLVMHGPAEKTEHEDARFQAFESAFELLPRAAAPAGSAPTGP